ncbi:STAS domain-containing protein [Streptomyces sp. NPDC050549]|uniref:STAS domain-containing protein n=1 Tax=Streptomyces sp. NPDC050549 TaxID=3155406 RepID=UPI00342D3F99
MTMLTVTASPSVSDDARAVPEDTAAPCDIAVRDCRTEGDTLALRASGALDHFTLAPLRVVLAVAPVYGYRHLLLDLAGLSFCDSALLAVLSHWCMRGRSMEITAASRQATRLLRLADAHTWLMPPGATERWSSAGGGF